MPDPAAQAEIITLLRDDPWQAHTFLFKHRHQIDGKVIAPAEFHEELVADFWSDDRYTVRMAFRGSGKSTLGEEDIALAACFVQYHNIVIIGASETRAAERLAAVSYELMHNELLLEVFGEQKSDRWTQTRIVTKRQVCVQAIGRDQDIRGIKFLDYRPDLVFVDDFEDKDLVSSPEGRAKTLRWFLAELLPACAPNRRIRVRATPMDAESVPMRLWKESRWPTRTYPIEYKDETGARIASWPALYPLQWIDRERRNYESVGELGIWEREFMCEAISMSDSPFRAETMRIVPREKTWQACYAMIDPARTVNRNSASTGWAVWSWTANRLIVWAAGAEMLLPDEIIELGFNLAARFDPVWLGVEADGLEQFLLQPFRHEMAKKGESIPFKAIRAPRGKLDFIRGLQPFFAAGEVEFAQDLPALKEQLLNFPRGRIDAPNALAYALQMRPGLAVYESFSPEIHAVSSPEIRRAAPLYIAANATGAITTAVLVQAYDGKLLILADWVIEGQPAEAAAKIASEAALFADSTTQVRVRAERGAWHEMLKNAVPDRLVTRRRDTIWSLAPHHADKFNNVGLLPAVRAIPAETRLAGLPVRGRQYLSDILGKSVRGLPAVEIGHDARWTLRALSGGYARAVSHGRIAEEPEVGPYRTLMEGLESFCALLHGGLAESDDEADNATNWATDRHGNRYRSVMPERRAG